MAPTNRLDRTPPRIEMTTRSAREIVVTPKATDTMRASAAPPRETARVRTVVAYRFSNSTPPRARLTSNRPEWIVVPSREAMAPKMLPRVAMATGIRTSRPGRRSSVPVIFPRTTPATRLPAVAMRRATNPWAMVRRSARQYARMRRIPRRILIPSPSIEPRGRPGQSSAGASPGHLVDLGGERQVLLGDRVGAPRVQADPNAVVVVLDVGMVVHALARLDQPADERDGLGE